MLRMTSPYPIPARPAKFILDRQACDCQSLAGTEATVSGTDTSSVVRIPLFGNMFE
jgi:hypothetical protein